MIEVDAAAVDLAKVEAAIKAMLRSGRLLTKPMKLIGRELRREVRYHAQNEEGPDGPWKPREWKSVKRGAAKKAKRRKGRTRRILGRLPTAVIYTSTASTVIATSRTRWSGVHQEGGTAGRGAKIPARPFLWLSPEMIAMAARILERFVANGWG